jgi:hypothetical protein
VTSRGKPDNTSFLYLHVGHGKTGSSYLQSWLAINAGVLETAWARVYPLRSPVTHRAESLGVQSRFSMGNGFILEDLLESGRSTGFREAARAIAPHPNSLVFSCERFMKSLRGRTGVIEGAARDAGFDGVKYLLFVRDPLEHACSLYAEMVKAHGYTSTLEEWFLEYDLLDHVEAFLASLDRRPRSELRVANYSRCRERVVEELGAWLGIDAASPSFDRPSRPRVNRSLTASELQVQLLANRLFGQEAAEIGRRLVDEVPGPPPDPPVASREARVEFLRRIGPVASRLNGRLPQEARYSLDPTPDARAPGSTAPVAGEAPFAFDSEQLSIIVAELYRAANRRRHGSRAVSSIARVRSLVRKILASVRRSHP